MANQNENKELPGATAEEIITVPVRVEEVPVAAMVWDGARIRSVVRAFVEDGLVVLAYQDGAPGQALQGATAHVVCGAASDRLVGRLAFYR